jgi:hypothetical protein
MKAPGLANPMAVQVMSRIPVLTDSMSTSGRARSRWPLDAPFGDGVTGSSGPRAPSPYAITSGRLLAGPLDLQPMPRRAAHDAEVSGDAADRGARSGLVQVDGLRRSPSEQRFLAMVLGSSRLPAGAGFSVPKHRCRPRDAGRDRRRRVREPWARPRRTDRSESGPQDGRKRLGVIWSRPRPGYDRTTTGAAAMTSFRTTRAPGSSRRIRPHVLRRDGIIQAPSDVPRHDRYKLAVAAGWRPLA